MSYKNENGYVEIGDESNPAKMLGLVLMIGLIVLTALTLFLLKGDEPTTLRENPVELGAEASEPATSGREGYAQLSLDQALMDISDGWAQTSIQKQHRMDKLVGQRVRWSGVVQDVIGYDGTDGLVAIIHIIVGSRQVKGTVYLRVSYDLLEELMALEKDYPISFDCRFDGLSMEALWLEDCQELRWENPR